MIHSDIRHRLEEREELLSPFAAKSRLSKGRLRPEEPSPMRTEFQRDRDRITHSLAFRRLKHKTQVFIAPLDDHYVTRLTHTLEVAQIARSISRALNLNEDLTEAIALGHDLGHTPFGHAGEEVLAELSLGGFRHNEQSLRVVDILEKEGQGLNLTWEVRDGILRHSKGRGDIFAPGNELPATLEGQICRVADVVAYINHDLNDALRAGVITEADLPQSTSAILGSSSSQRINTMVCDIVDFSWSVNGQEGKRPIIAMSPPIAEAALELREFLFERVYAAEHTEVEEAKAILRHLYHHFLNHQEELPPEFFLRDEDAPRRTLDYVAGMTDNYARELFRRLGSTSSAQQRAG